jgi:hypothetical protein
VKDSRAVPVFMRALGPRRSEAVSSGDGSTPRRGLAGLRVVAEGICETSPVDILDTIDDARRAFEVAGQAASFPPRIRSGSEHGFQGDRSTDDVDLPWRFGRVSGSCGRTAGDYG